MPTQLEQFFDSINADLVKHFIQVRQQEHLQLEFKTVRDAEMRSSDDRRNLAKSLSGFANSSGGVVIWGVKARGGGEQYIVESSPILRVQDFAMRLDELIGQAVSPAVEGVRNKWFSTDGSRGIAVTIVPESSSGPHMAKLG
jgi:predicted HTH transcriptional regulator